MPTGTAMLVHTLYIAGSACFLTASLISMFHIK